MAQPRSTSVAGSGVSGSISPASPARSVTGVTLSEEQFAVATNRARQMGLADRVEFRLQDYRDVSETFDRIVSVGMFEHVGATGTTNSSPKSALCSRTMG